MRKYKFCTGIKFITNLQKKRGGRILMRRYISVIVLITAIIFFSANTFSTAASQQNGTQSIYTGKITGINHCTVESGEQVTVLVDNYTEYRTLRLPNPERIVIDFVGVKAPITQQAMNVNSKLIKNIRYAQFQEGVARVVIDTGQYLDFTVEKRENRVIVNVKSINNREQSAGDKQKTDEEKSQQGSPRSGEDLLDRGVVNRKDYFKLENMKINYFGKGSIDEVHIKIDKYDNYKVYTLSNPDRLVVDFYIDRISDSNNDYKFEVGRGLVKTIRYARYDSNIVRVVVDVSSAVKYKVEEEKNKLILKIDNPNFKNILYHNNGDRVYFTLAGATLTEGGETLKKYYTGQYDDSGTKYTLTFPSKLANLKSGVIRVNDDLLDSVEIINSNESPDTSIIFNAKDKFHYEVFTRKETNETAITLLKPVSRSDKLVVIDPGHGGHDPGAVYKSVREKDLNLDIALRLNELLKEKNIKTYMMREDDSFVSLYERAYIANSLNASLFLSIHNNAMDNTAYGGTMTLCYPARSNSKDFTGQAFAQIVQENLIKKLGTADRKVVNRPNLVVLKATKMPAALAEVAFITNAADRNNLQNATFRQKAAQALCDAIIQALTEMDKYTN